jgi:hypothetical protein
LEEAIDLSGDRQILDWLIDYLSKYVYLHSQVTALKLLARFR